MLKVIFNRAIHEILSVDLPVDKIHQIQATTWEIHASTPKSADRGANVSIGFLLALARNNIAFYKAMLQADLEPQQARDYLEQLNWGVSKFLGRPLFLLSGLFARGDRRRMVWSNEVLWKFLFRQPFARKNRAGLEDNQNIATDSNDLVFDVTVCPFQEYYRAQNLIEICEYAACRQDYRLAESWNAKFKRSKTLANGDDCCDFHFISNGTN